MWKGEHIQTLSFPDLNESTLQILMHILPKSISTSAQYVTLHNKIKCLSLAVCFFWGNPTNKTVTGTAYTWELLTAKHLDQSLWSTNQKYSAAVRSNLVQFFLELRNCVALFTSLSMLHEFGAEKLISWTEPAHFDFFTIISTVWSQILSTGEAALSVIPLWYTQGNFYKH
jgi:hypothetical protein